MSLLAVVAALTLACDRADRAEEGGATPRSSASRATPTDVAPPQTRPLRPRIVFLGDSLTAGYGLDKRQAVPALIQEELDAAGYVYEVVNAGVSGDTSAGGLSRLEWALDGDVRVLVVELGANDGLRGLPTESMERNLSEIIRRAKGRQIAVVLTGMEAPPNYGAAYTAAYRRVFADLARAHDVTFVPFYLEGVAGIPALNIADGIHPNVEGARIVARTVWHALQPLVEKQDR